MWKTHKNSTCSDHFWTFRCRFAWQAQGIVDLVKSEIKWAKREGFVAFPKTMASVGHLKRICKDAFSVAGALQETCSSEMLGGQGADFLRGVAFWSIKSSGLLKWFCVTGAALRMSWHHFCVAGAALYTDGVEKSQNALARGRQLCTQLCMFEGSLAKLLLFWHCQLRKLRKSRSFVFDIVNFENWGSLAASFLTLSSSKFEEVSQNFFVFWRCQVQKLRKSRRIAALLMLSSSKIEEVSQSSSVFKLAGGQIDRSIDR